MPPSPTIAGFGAMTGAQFSAPYDDAVAEQLAVALGQLAEELARVQRRLLDAAGPTTLDWQGASHRWFEDRYQSLFTRLGQAVSVAAEDLAGVRADQARAAGRRQEEARMAALAEAATRAEATPPEPPPPASIWAGQRIATQ